MFDEKTQQELKSYVYALFSNEEQLPFYIGKGKNNRVFDHLRCAISDDTSINLKYETIRNSENIRHIIVRHGLTEKESFIVESALIDMFDFIKHSLTNIAGGHNAIEKGLMTTDELTRLYNAEPLEEMPPNSVIININGTYKRGNDKDAIYNATKESWVIAREKIPTLKYVLSEYRGLIVEVFETESWKEFHATTSQGRKKVRWGFTGKIAEDSFRKRYLNKSIKEFKKSGHANPIRYVLNKKK